VARALEFFIVLGLGVAVAVVVRDVRATRSPRRALDGSGPVIGSLDAWPAVPRAPQATGRAASSEQR
jgi:hypothetical protein